MVKIVYTLYVVLDTRTKQKHQKRILMFDGDRLQVLTYSDKFNWNYFSNNYTYFDI